MPIISFSALFAQASTDVQAAADQVRYLAQTTGDMQMYQFLNIWQTMAAANASSMAALTQAASNPTAANAALPQFTGAPQTVSALQAGLVAIKTAAAAFKAATEAWRDANLTAADLMVFGVLNGSDMLNFATVIPAAKIDLLRADPSVAALVAAFDAIGATA